MNIFRSRQFVCSVLFFVFVSFLIPPMAFAQAAAREKSGAEVFLKWFTIGAVVVGTVVGVATVGLPGLFFGPLIGAAAATLTGLIFQANPVDQWRAVFNKAPAYNNRNVAGMAYEMYNGKNTSNAASFANSASKESVDNSDMMEAFAAYQKAHKAYQEAVSSGDQTNIAAKAAAVRETKAALDAAKGR